MSGRPRRYDARTSTAIRLPADLHERLVAAAEEREVSMNFLITQAVREFLDRLLPVEEIRWTTGPTQPTSGATPWKPCFAVDPSSTRYYQILCSQPKGHDGPHRNGAYEWPNMSERGRS